MEPQNNLRIEVLLEEVVKKRASDLHIQVGLPPMLRVDGSLNPTDFADRLAQLPQRHLVGDRDTVMPRAVVESYMRKVKPQCAEVITVSATHTQGFETAWAQLKDRAIDCKD